MVGVGIGVLVGMGVFVGIVVLVGVGVNVGGANLSIVAQLEQEIKKIKPKRTKMTFLFIVETPFYISI